MIRHPEVLRLSAHDPYPKIEGTGHTLAHSTSLESCGPIFVADQLALQEGFQVDEILRTTQLMIVWNTSS